MAVQLWLATKQARIPFNRGAGTGRPAVGRRKVVVVGGGPVAQRRLPNLLAANAKVVVVAVDPTPAVEANPLVEIQWRPYADGDLDGAWYAIATPTTPT